MGRLTCFISAHNSFSLSIASLIVFLTQISSHSSKYSFGTQILNHFRSFVCQIFGSMISFQGSDVFSLGSSQFMISYNNHASFTVFVIVHGQSKLDAIGNTHSLEFLPYHGLNHTTQQNDAGCLRLPHVSVQSAAGISQAATAEADHELDQPGTLFVHQGLRVGQNAEFSHVDHIANSSIFSFQIELIQASFSFFITVASYGGTKSFNIFELQVVGIHFSANISFTQIGIQAKTESGFDLNQSLFI
jgi:hypothetical protein